MLGAIIGDIVGSRFEHDNIKTKKFDFLTYRCKFTDDSVMSLAIAQAILDCKFSNNSLAENAITHRQPIYFLIYYMFLLILVIKKAAKR